MTAKEPQPLNQQSFVDNRPKTPPPPPPPKQTLVVEKIIPGHSQINREQIALKVMGIMLANNFMPNLDDTNEKIPIFGNGDGRLVWNHLDHPKDIAQLAFEMADAMLAKSDDT